MCMKRCVVLLLILILGASTTCLAAQPEPAIAFGATSVRVSGLTPHGSVVLVGVTHEPDNAMRRVTRYGEILTADADGTATLELKRGVPPSSVWAAVLIPTGRVAAAGGPNVGLREFAVRPQSFRRNASRDVDALGLGITNASVLYVLGSKVWMWNGIDGAAGDDDAIANETLVLKAGKGKSLSSDPESPPAFRPGGTLVVIDPTRLEIAVVDLDSKWAGEVP